MLSLTPLLLGAAAMINEAIQKCDVDVRRDMWGGIVLTGGGALLPGLRERLEQVLRGFCCEPRHLHNICIARLLMRAAAWRA